MIRCTALLILLPSLLHAQELRLDPPNVVLTGPKAMQRLLALELNEAKVVVADKTGETNFTSSNPKIVSVDAMGQLRAIGDGEVVPRQERGVKGRRVTDFIRAGRCR